MQHRLRLVVFLLVAFLPAYGWAQEAIYFANGDKLPNARLTNATDERVVLRVKRDGVTSQYRFMRTNVLMAFNAVGDFLLISSLPADTAAAQQRIREFSEATQPVYQTDFLVRAVPLTVIPASISYESDQVVNYKTAQGTAASISKQELIMILRRDGRHQLVMLPTEVVSLLPTIRKQIETGGTSAVAATPKPDPVAAPEPTTTPTEPASTAVTTTPVAPASGTTPTVVVVVNNNQAAEPTPPTPATTAAPTPDLPTPETPTADVRPSLNEAEYLMYREKAMRHVVEFSAYLEVITNKNLSLDRRNQAIEQAAQLFIPTATIAVTSKNRPGSRNYPIRDYLNRLTLLPYNRTNIEWSEVQYVRELVQAADGFYYGTLTGQQTFIGYGADGRTPLYSDVTRKNVRVRVTPKPIYKDGKESLRWDVLLGNIGVANN